MTEKILHAPTEAPLGLPKQDITGDALAESSQRWRQLVGLATDFAFETDADGRFVLLMPDTVLGWSAAALIGEPSELLTGGDGADGTANLFRPTAEVRRHRTWVRRFNGSLAMVTVSASPLYDAAGHRVGARGVGINMDSDAQTSQIAGRLRHGQTLDHILAQVGREANADGMMDAALWALIHALGAEGSAVVGATSETAQIEVLHECGPGASTVLAAAGRLLAAGTAQPGQTTSLDGRIVLAAGCKTRFGANTGLAIWRKAHHRRWDEEDMSLVASAVNVVRMVLEYEAVQQELTQQSRTDPLTGLFNRRAFLEEIDRQIARLDGGSETGTLMLVDLDAFKAVNDRLGHATGDDLLVCFAEILRKLVRPTDLVARLEGDEFVMWLSGADHMTAAERADHLCKTVPADLQALLPEGSPALGASIGLATRRPGSQESIEALMQRADEIMHEVKQNGGGHWRVSPLDRP